MFTINTESRLSTNSTFLHPLVSSTSEADSEEEGTAHKMGPVVSPLVGRRGRRSTRDSRHSNDGESEQVPDGGSSKAQAIVKPVLDEKASTTQEDVNPKSKKHPVIDEDKSVDEVNDCSVPILADAQANVAKKSSIPETPQSGTENEKPVQSSDIVSSADDADKTADSTEAEKVNEDESNKQDVNSTSNAADSVQAEEENNLKDELIRVDDDCTADKLENSRAEAVDKLKQESTQQDAVVCDEEPKDIAEESMEADDEKPQASQSESLNKGAAQPTAKDEEHKEDPVTVEYQEVGNIWSDLNTLYCGLLRYYRTGCANMCVMSKY